MDAFNAPDDIESVDQDAGRLYEVLKRFDTTMLVTRSRDGSAHARPMAVVDLGRDRPTYLVTSVESGKAAEIAEDPAVTLLFQDSRHFAALSGTAAVVRDQALIERLWREPWKVWFPQGHTDPSIRLIRVDATAGEYWDNAGARGLKYVLEAAKAYASGRTARVDPTQHAKVPL